MSPKQEPSCFGALRFAKKLRGARLHANSHGNGNVPNANMSGPCLHCRSGAGVVAAKSDCCSHAWNSETTEQFVAKVFESRAVGRAPRKQSSLPPCPRT